MSQFTHGTRVKEQETKLKMFLSAKMPTVIIGTAAINQGDIECVNKPILIQNSKDAAKYFGGTNNIPGFTINEALYLAFNVYGVAPIIAINVLDPSKHKTEGTEEALVLVDRKVKLKEYGILNNSKLIVKNNSISTPLEKEKYTVNYDNDGKLVVTVSEIEKSVTSIDVSYEYLDTKKVTEDDVIGKIDPQSLEASGMENIKNIFPTYAMIPSCVIAPDFATEKIKAALFAKSNIINDKWGSISIPEIPNTTKYGEMLEFKKSKNYIESSQLINFGVPYLGDQQFHMSTCAALLMQSVDAKNDGVPYESPSNKNCRMEGIGYFESEKFKKINLDETEANLLNENGISTIIRQPNGTVFWGNRTSVFQPGGNTDPKDVWIPIKRMFKYIGNTIMLNNINEVDKPMTPSQCKSIETNINVWLSSLVAEGKLLGGRVEFRPEENPEQEMIAGKYKWHVFLGAVLPGETLEFILEYDGKYLKELFK